MYITINIALEVEVFNADRVERWAQAAVLRDEALDDAERDAVAGDVAESTEQAVTKLVRASIDGLEPAGMEVHAAIVEIVDVD